MPETEQHNTPAGLGKLSYAEAIAHTERMKMQRVGLTAFVALVTATIAPLPLVAFAYGYNLINELVVQRWLSDWAAPADRNRTDRDAFRKLAVTYIFGVVGYNALPLIAVLSQTPLGLVLATAWVSGGAIHSFVYYSNNRLLLWANLVPLMIFGAAIPFLNAHAFDLHTVLMSTLILSMFAAAGMFSSDRNELLKALASQYDARRIAERASMAKTQFLKTMSHELRTPLNAVIGYAEIMEEDLAALKAENSRDDARKIGAAGRHLLGLIDDVLDMADIESGAVELVPVTTDISALLRDVEGNVRSQAESRGNTLSFEGARLPLVAVDSAKLRQCVLNLASNACKFTEHGTIEVRAALAGDFLTFKIADTGVGIDADHAAHLFDAFVQSDGSHTRKFGGSGLGLAITRRLARLMDGDVTVESTPGAGSTFTLTVRVRRVDETAPAFAAVA